MKNSLQEHVIVIPISSAERSPKGLLPGPASQYHIPPPSNGSPKFKQNKVVSVITRMNKLGERADSFALGIREHVRLGPKISETVKGKLSLGAKILQVGGVAKVFKHNFSVREGEKLLKASQCYLSTTAGPIAGLLFISTDKVAFCSERSIKLSSQTGELIRVPYKVLIPLRKIRRANECENVKKPSQKYIEVVTEDNFDFWFMGFLNYPKTLKCLQQAISLSSSLGLNSAKGNV
uniref:Putative GEM-like protein 4 n=1 Tax=Davidia involucrata TaxID=16924 RepID=A0A5B6YH88_DAVIN